MLTLDRSEGETVYLNDDKLIIKAIEANLIYIEINNELYALKLRSHINFKGTKIHFIRNANSKSRKSIRVRIGFDADKKIRIERGENYNPAKGGNSRFTDNSTKQFPSDGEY